LVLVAIKEALESPMELLLDNNLKKHLIIRTYFIIKTRLVLKQGGFLFLLFSLKALIFYVSIFFIKKYI
jgi:hypothetical protein